MKSWIGITESNLDMRTKIWCGILENSAQITGRTLLRTLLIGLNQNFALLFDHIYVHMHVFFLFILFLVAQVVADVTGN